MHIFVNIFLSIYLRCVLCAQKNHLIGTVLLSTHNICFVIEMLLFFQKWINVLKQHCVNTQITRILKRSTVLKELRSLSVGVVQCRNLPQRYLSHPFCYLTLNDIKVCRTQVVDMTTLFWGEDFTLE